MDCASDMQEDKRLAWCIRFSSEKTCCTALRNVMKLEMGILGASIAEGTYADYRMIFAGRLD